MLKTVLGRSVSYLRKGLATNFSCLSLRNHLSTANMALKYLNMEEAKRVDYELMGTYGFSIDQLMELAGLSVAHVASKFLVQGETVLVVCGPGNNGGDGFVCARHLKLFGYNPSVVYPKHTGSALMNGFITQMKSFDIPFVDDSIRTPEDVAQYSLVIDAMFGFGFHPPVGEPFNNIIELIVKSGVQVLSVDTPSGWHVEDGPPKGDIALQPDVLISLTAPKKCARFFNGKHFLGGRFIPSSMAERFALNLPEYPGTDPIVQLD